MKREIQRYFELNENGNTTYANLGDIVKVVLRDKFIVINQYIRTKEKLQTNCLNFHLQNIKSRENETKSKQKNKYNKEQKSMKQKNRKTIEVQCKQNLFFLRKKYN